MRRLAAYLGVDVNPKDLDHNTDGARRRAKAVI
jgi:hypothetical protein